MEKEQSIQNLLFYQRDEKHSLLDQIQKTISYIAPFMATKLFKKTPHFTQLELISIQPHTAIIIQITFVNQIHSPSPSNMIQILYLCKQKIIGTHIVPKDNFQNWNIQSHTLSYFLLILFQQNYYYNQLNILALYHPNNIKFKKHIQMESPEQSNPQTVLANARYDHSTNIRRNARNEQINKIRMQNILSDPDKIEEEKYKHLNLHVYTLQELPFLCQCINQEQNQKIVYGLMGIRKLLCDINTQPPIDQIINTGIIQRIIKISENSCSIKMQIQALWILANICAGKPQHVALLIDKGIIPLIYELLKRQISLIQENAIWIVGNISGDSELYRNVFLTNGTIKEIVRIYFKSNNKQIKKCCGWVASNIVRTQNPIDEMIIKLSMPLFIDLVRKVETQGIEQITNDCIWALSKLSSKSKYACLNLVKQKMIPIFIKIGSVSESPSILIPCIRIFGNITSKLQSEIDYLLQEGVLQLFHSTLQNKQMLVRKQTSWVISNISAGTKTQAQAVFNSSQLLIMLQSLLFNDYIQVKIQAAWVFSNFIAHIYSQNLFPLFKKVIEGFLFLLQQDSNIKALQIGLLGVEHYLKLLVQLQINIDCQNTSIHQRIVENLHKLQHHPNSAIYNKIKSIIQKFLVDDGQEDDDLF